MPIFAVYKTSTGEITQIQTTPESTIIVDSGEDYIEVDSTVSDAAYRIDISTVTPELKPSVPVAAALNTTVNTTVPFTNIPSGEVSYSSTVLDDTNPVTVAITDGVLDFTTDLAGEYTLVFTAPLYLDTTTVITVTD